MSRQSRGIPLQIAETTVSASGDELNYLDLGTLGTGAASKAVVLDAGEDYVWPSAGLLTYGGTQVTATGAELNLTDGAIASVGIVLSAGGTANEVDVTCTVKDAAGTTIAAAHNLEIWISDSATTKVLTSTNASGAFAAIDGSILTSLTAELHLIVVTPVSGVINMSLIDTAKTQGEVFYIKLPNGLTSQSAATQTADYN